MENHSASQISYFRVSTPLQYYVDHLTLLLVLKGQMTVEHDEHLQQLGTHTLYCLNGHQFATFSPTDEQESVVLALEIDSLFFADQFPAFFTVHFHIPSAGAAATTNGELLQAIAELALNEFNRRDEQKIYRMMKLEAIIFLLAQRYQSERHHPIQISSFRQLPDILHYIDAHVHEGVKVKHIAEHFYLSESALSKLFKKETGEQLSHYIKKIQIHKSLPSLQHSKKSVEQIALEASFASVKVYRDQFKSFMHTTPTAYRHAQPHMAYDNTLPRNTHQSDLSNKEILHLLYQAVQQQPTERPLLIDRRSRHLLIDDCDFMSFDGDPNFVFLDKHSEKSSIESSHHYIQEKIHWLRKVCHDLAFHKPLYILNWNTLTGANVDYNGLFFRGAIIVQELLGLSQQIQGYGFWLNNALHEQYTFGRPGLHAYSTGLDLYHFQSKKRPAFFCLSLIRRLRGQVIAQGDEYLLTKDEQTYQLLLWNTNFFDPHLSSEEAFLESQALAISLDVRALPAGRYQIKQLDLDRNYGAVFYV